MHKELEAADDGDKQPPHICYCAASVEKCRRVNRASRLESDRVALRAGQRYVSPPKL
jgi:hypothetical protein